MKRLVTALAFTVASLLVVEQSVSSPLVVARAGNPLWTIPLETLSATRARPLFSPSRRPPPPQIVRTRPLEPVHLPKRVSESERPHLKLIGTISGKTEGFGIFVDPSTKAVIRLKTGGEYQGWILRSVKGREVVLEKNHLTALLRLPTHADGRTGTVRQEAMEHRFAGEGPRE